MSKPQLLLQSSLCHLLLRHLRNMFEEHIIRLQFGWLHCSLILISLIVDGHRMVQVDYFLQCCQITLHMYPSTYFKWSNVAGWPNENVLLDGVVVSMHKIMSCSLFCGCTAGTGWVDVVTHIPRLHIIWTLIYYLCGFHEYKYTFCIYTCIYKCNIIITLHSRD